MTALMRIRLEQATRITRSAHAGLLLNRGLTAGEADGPKPLKAALIKKISQINPCELYKKAFDRWVAATTKSEQFSFIAAKIEGRLFIGLCYGWCH
jgi:CRISPR-associated protein Cmr6